jgi:hypothetical protein
MCVLRLVTVRTTHNTCSQPDVCPQIGDGADYGVELWGNQELQCYQDTLDVAEVVPKKTGDGAKLIMTDGILRLTALYTAVPFRCANAVAPRSGLHNYKSAKVVTEVGAWEQQQGCETGESNQEEKQSWGKAINGKAINGKAIKGNIKQW